MSFSFADPEFEPPYITAAGALPFPALELRVALVSAQLINYSSLGGTDGAGWKAVAGPLAGGGGESSGGGASWEGRLRLLHNAFRSQSQHFDRSYRGEIAAKYVAASADAVAAAAAAAAAAVGGGEEVVVAVVFGAADDEEERRRRCRRRRRRRRRRRHHQPLL